MYFQPHWKFVYTDFMKHQLFIKNECGTWKMQKTVEKYSSIVEQKYQIHNGIAQNVQLFMHGGVIYELSKD